MEPYHYRARIVKVTDGDSVIVNIDLGFSITLAEQRIRLTGLDCPESRSKDPDEKKRGLLSTKRLRALLPIGSEVLVHTSLDELEKYGRILGDIRLSDGRSVVEVMIKEGYGVAYSGENKELLKEAHEANAKKLRSRGELS